VEKMKKKSKIPNPKSQRSTKSQMPSRPCETADLELGAWDLELGISSL
jgi:hypothetical protein